MTDSTVTIGAAPAHAGDAEAATARTGDAAASFRRAVAARFRVEAREFVRQREGFFFSFLLPVILMVLFGSIFDDEIVGSGVSFTQYFFAGMVATVGLSVGFSGLGGQVASHRASGTLKRLAGTPMPLAAYVVATTALVVLVAVAQTGILLGLGALAFDLDLPATAADWLTFAWVLALGLVAFSVAGVAYSSLIPDVRSISPMLAPPFIALPFISGVYFVFSELPGWMQATANLFPLRWMALGVRSAMLPDAFASAEPGGTWQLQMVALVLGLWVVGGVALTLRTFRLGRARR